MNGMGRRSIENSVFIREAAFIIVGKGEKNEKREFHAGQQKIAEMPLIEGKERQDNGV